MSTKRPAKLHPLRRVDGKWGWRLVTNGHIVATDGAQGYSRRTDMVKIAERLFAPGCDVGDRAVAVEWAEEVDMRKERRGAA